MKSALFAWIGIACLSPLHAQEGVERMVFPAVVKPAMELEGWGKGVDTEGDCKFELKEGRLAISIPAFLYPRDLAAEINRVNAPRVVVPVKGDFLYQVKTGGLFVPGGDSTQAGRTGYNGAAIILMADTDHVVTLARAVLQTAEREPVPYANFEMRSGGQLDRMGNSGDGKIPLEGPVWLRMERKGRTITASVSENGVDWKTLVPRELPVTWPEELFVGVAAITTSKFGFSPEFSEQKRE